MLDKGGSSQEILLVWEVGFEEGGVKGKSSVTILEASAARIACQRLRLLILDGFWNFLNKGSSDKADNSVFRVALILPL